jgi:hypothetical protein
MIPDAEAIVGAYLRAYADIKSLGARVVGATPKKKDTAWVQVTQIDYPAVDDHRAEYLLEWIGQFDCYAGKDGGQREASLLTRTVRQALSVMATETVDGAVFSGVRCLSSPRILDTDLEPARERYALTAAIYLHPA